MITNKKIVLAAALLLGTASAALANDIETSPSEAQSAREWRDFLGQSRNQNHMGGGTGYGYFASPTQQEDLSQSGRRSRNH